MVIAEEYLFTAPSSGTLINRYIWVDEKYVLPSTHTTTKEVSESNETPEPSGPKELNLDWANLTGTIVLIHGFRTHIKFNYLRSYPPSTYNIYENSIIERFVDLGYVVIGHDHVSHGKSEGQIRAYFETMDMLVNVTLDAIDEALWFHSRHLHSDSDLETKKPEPLLYSELPAQVLAKPRFILGHSLGGSVSICACLKRPEFFHGGIFSSAAVEPPANMLGTKGYIMASISGFLSWLMPTTEVIQLPPNHLFPDLHQLFENDPLCVKSGVRARVGHEFLKLYEYIFTNAKDIITPFLISDGKEDTLVNPDGAVRFVEHAVKCEDKSVKIFENMWHNLFIEPGAEKVYDEYVGWVQHRS
mmetsp:Transcript_16375/g.28649  ORF Transcript_16375/g.28649 Transcript_16375/m.28649 type:complete len:358 (+) Transcript_16375:110-1183(+)